jgi:hypothetical protein
MPRTLSFVFYVITFTLLANPVWADCEVYRNLEGRTWVDGTCMETPLGERWWPHPLWGEGDQAGSTNWYTKPEVIARALAQVKLNRVLKIGQEYSAEMPLFESRSFSLRIPGGSTGDALGKNQVVWRKFSKVKADPDCQFDPERTRPRYTGQEIATMIAA